MQGQKKLVPKKVFSCFIFFFYKNNEISSKLRANDIAIVYFCTMENNNHIIKTDTAAKPLGAYPHARKVGNLLFLSGIGSRSAVDNSIPGLEMDEQGNIVKYDIEAECRSVFANVKAVLEASGSKIGRAHV